MKSIHIIGIGMGADTTTKEALELIRNADVLIGASRMIGYFSDWGKQTHSTYLPEEVAAIVEQSPCERFAVLLSGDVGFFSGAKKLYERLCVYDVRLVAGVSSVNYFFAKCGLPWQDAALVSAHGTTCGITGSVRRNRLAFVLTGGNTHELVYALCDAGYADLPLYTGENLGNPDERIVKTKVSAACEQELSPLTVLLIENENFDTRVRTGIPDSEFICSDIPMTKAEVRALSLSKLGLSETDLCYDIGCGTGSVCVEMALSAHRGHVYAFDKNEPAVTLTKENCRRFHVGNVTVVLAPAPEAFIDQPTPDAAFIGGSAGAMDSIMQALTDRNADIRIVVNAITLESVSAAISALERVGRTPEVIQLSVSRAKRVSGLHMMVAQNPIFIVSSGNRHE